MSNKSTFSRNLKYQMDLNNKSRQEISTALGISYFTITSWANGTKYPRMDKVEMLANYFGCTKSDLIEEQQKEPTENDGLTENQIKLMQFVKSVPDDKAEMLLRVMKSIVEAD